MATLNASKWGYISTGNQTTFTAARDATTGTATSQPTTNQYPAIEYNKFSGRGRGSIFYRVVRTFYYFDTSGITGTVSSATINIKDFGSFSNADVIVVPSTAFSGDGSSLLANGDFDAISFNSTYGAQYTGWSTGNNSITLRSQALSDIENNDYFICAVIEHDHDYSNVEDLATGGYNNGIDFSTTAYLDYTEAASGPANVASFLGITKANISTINTITLGNVSELNGIS